MDKKNYLTKEEYKLWSYIKEKETIDAELINQIFPELSKNKKDKLLHNLYKKGYLRRARKNLYYNPLKLKSFYSLAFKIKDGYIGLSSALKYYNLIDYEDFTIFIMTNNFQKTIPLQGTKYEIKFIPLKNLFTGFQKINDLYISSIEKTIFDCLLKPRYISFSNIAKALYDSKINWNKFINFFKLTNNHALYQRTGYLLDLLKKEVKLKIPPFVFKFLLKKIKNPVKLTPTTASSILNRKWMIQDNLGKEKILSWWY